MLSIDFSIRPPHGVAMQDCIIYSQLRSSDKVTHEELHLAFACRHTAQLQCQ